MPDTDQRPAPPLAGIRVLDLTRVLAGPFSTMTLGDLGAEVIKVESPKGGDDTRQWGAVVAGRERSYFLTTNRNKKSIAIDFATPEGAELVRELAARSDVLVENYKLGGLNRYGLDYASLRAVNPRLVYCSISGYGRTGPGAARAGYDLVVQAESGLMSVTGEPDGRPMRVGAALTDIMTGAYAVQAILAALMVRERTGEGQAIDLSMFECSLANLGPIGGIALALNEDAGRYGNAHGDIVPYDSFPAGDGDVIMAIGNDYQFRKLCQVLGRPDLAEDPRFLTNPERRAHRDALTAELSKELRKDTREAWIRKLHQAQVPAGSVRSVLEAMHSPEAVGRGIVKTIRHPVVGELRQVGSPMHFSATPVVEPAPPPLLGEHTDAILRGILGKGEDEIEALRQRQAVA